MTSSESGGGYGETQSRGAGETDQSGFEYRIGYQPDWLRHVKVTRDLEGGRQSTKTLFRNPVERREALPGDQVRARITCLGQELDFGVAIPTRGE